ncbi:MAG: 50S ribosomal protein L28 [Defluviitaleaceae bacterium]|nr:50S ribosomal protein L28 [Defluviitaleaceae bacterium]
MANRCNICDKGTTTGHRISITRSQVSRRANRTWKPNLKKIKVVLPNGTVTTSKVCTACIRSGKIKRAS